MGKEGDISERGEEFSAGGGDEEVFMDEGEGDRTIEGTEEKYVKRKRHHSLDSPERVKAVLREAMGEKKGESSTFSRMKKEAEEAMEEIRNYVVISLPRKDNKHEKFMGKRLGIIGDVVNKMMGEIEKLERYNDLAEKHKKFEREIKKLLTMDLELVLKERTEEVVREVSRMMGDVALRNSQSVQERIKEDVDSWIKASDGVDEQRQRDMHTMENKYQEKFNALNKKVEEMEGSMKVMNKFMENVRMSMDVVNNNICRVGEVIEGVPWSGVQEMGAKLDVLKGVDVREVKGEMEKVVEEVEKVVSQLKEVKEVRGAVGGDGEPMEVDIPFAEVVRKGSRRRSGPQVVIKSPKEEDKVIKGKEVLVDCLGKKDGEVRVRNMRLYGKDIVMDVHNEEDLEKLKGNERLREEGFDINGEPSMRKPRVIIYGVDRDIKREELLEAVRGRNPYLFNDWSSGEYIIGSRRNAAAAWVVRVEGDY